MDYQERVEAVAGMWRYYFQETVMTKEQQMEFRKCCKDAVETDGWWLASMRNVNR